MFTKAKDVQSNQSQLVTPTSFIQRSLKRRIGNQKNFED